MRKLDLDEIRRYHRTYETLITATQIVDSISGWWGSPEIKDNEFNKVFMEGVPADKVRRINDYVASANLVPIGSVDDSDYSDSCFDLSSIFNDVRMNESTPVIDVKNAIMLSNDICYKLTLLQPLMHYLYCESSSSDCLKDINKRCKTALDKDFYGALTLYSYTYMHYGKRSAWPYYEELLKYASDINRLCEEFSLPIIIPEY